MNMNDFQDLAVCGIRVGSLQKRIEKGLMFLNDHMEEAAALYVKLEKAKVGEGGKVADEMADMLGFMLVDIALICDGLMMNMGSIAKRNLMNVMEQKEAERDLGEESAKSILKKVCELAGKVVQSDE